MPIAPGDDAPLFLARRVTGETFQFERAAGSYLVLAFPSASSAAGRAAVMEAVGAHAALFDGVRCTFFGVLRHPAAIAKAVDAPPGVCWLADEDGALSRLYGMIDDTGAEGAGWVVLDPTLRVLFQAPIAATAAVMRELAALPPVDDHAGTLLTAPVLIVPRVFEADFCQRLIGLYVVDGGRPSGFMRDVDGLTVEVQDPTRKRRKDFNIQDVAEQNRISSRLVRRLTPSIARAFQFQVTRIERYLVACYDAADRGGFMPHRDNTTRATLHRRFAVTINLNDDFDGGDLRFPEFGSRTYRAPVGGAVVFSCSLLHEAGPVTRGRRFAFLPFLYDEAAARVREENSGYLASNPGGYRADGGKPPSP